MNKLEEFLAAAKSGHMRALAYACASADRSIMYSWTGSADAHDMCCAVTKLFYHFLSAEKDLDV